jgi:hypothetical protein
MLNMINTQPVRPAFFRNLSQGVTRIVLAVGLAAAPLAAGHQTAAAQSMSHSDAGSEVSKQKPQSLAQAEASKRETQSLSHADPGARVTKQQ